MSRKLVSVLFLDLVGWTRLAESLDPEPLQQLLERYYEICVQAVEQHEGVVEKFIGDAVMAVFGAERSREDDALRALRTATRIRDDLAALAVSGDRALRVHCGVAAGEALVTRSPRAGLRVVGDVVNLAARLQSAAPADEVFVNEVVVRLVRSALVMEPIEPLRLKGKREPVPTWRLAGVADPAARQVPAAGFLDRDAERQRLRQAYREVVRGGRMRLVAVLGAPGIGKSRLVREAVGSLAAGGVAARAAFGACPSYGGTDGYAALRQVLDTLLGDGPAGGDRRVDEVLRYVRDPSTVAASVAVPGVEEVCWAVREVVARLAARPLVLVWDDLQWAAASLLDLIGDLATNLADHPVLMICLARQDLLSRRPPWLEAGCAVAALEMEPLPPGETAALVSSLAVAHAMTAEVMAHEAELLDRVTADSGGNPLVAELMVETVAAGYRLDEVPPTVAAMVGAMVDRLPDGLRELLEAASVVGPAFTLEQVRRLYPAAAAAAAGELRRRRLVRATAASGRYEFAQQAVHAVVYGRLDKQQRLAWHRQLAADRVDPPFHLESAARLLLDLDPEAAGVAELAGQAAGALLREGTRALRRRDQAAAVDLLERACEIARHGDERCLAVAAVRLSDALVLSSNLRRAATVVREAAARLGPATGLLCRVQSHLLALRSGQGEQVVDDLAGELAEAGAGDLAWCRYQQVRMLRELAVGRFRAAEEAVAAALAHARAAADRYEEDRLLVAACEIGQWSPTRIEEKLRACVALRSRFAGDRCLLVPVLAAQARFRVLVDDPAGAWAALAVAKAAVTELRLTMGGVLVEQVAGVICALTGAGPDAVDHYRRAADLLARAGHHPDALTMRVLAVREMVDAGAAAAGVRDELDLLARRLDRMDLRGRVLYRTTRARAAAAAGQDPAGAGREALRALAATDDACLRGDAYFDLARAYRRAGRPEHARAHAEAALRSYDAIGATLPMRRLRAWT